MELSKTKCLQIVKGLVIILQVCQKHNYGFNKICIDDSFSFLTYLKCHLPREISKIFHKKHALNGSPPKVLHIINLRHNFLF